MKFRMIILVLLVTTSAFSQETFKGEHFIEVSGSAQMEVDPNEIILFVRLREFEENKNKVLLEKLDQDFLAALKASGIDKKNLTLADAGSQLGKLGKREKDAFREKSYELKLSSAAELTKFITSLEKVKVEQLDIRKVSHTEIEKFRLDLKVKALQAAQAKAQALLRGIGSEAGKPLMVREWEQDGPMPLYSNARISSGAWNPMNADDGGIAEPAVEFKKITLRSQITAQFEIK